MFDTEHLSLSCRPSVYARGHCGHHPSTLDTRPLGEQPHHRGKRERHVEDIFALGGLCEFTLIHLSRFPLVMRLPPEGRKHVLHAGELDPPAASGSSGFRIRPAARSSIMHATVWAASGLLVPMTPVGPRLIQPAAYSPRTGRLVSGSRTLPLSFRMTPQLSLKGTPGSGTPR